MWYRNQLLYIFSSKYEIADFKTVLTSLYFYFVRYEIFRHNLWNFVKFEIGRQFVCTERSLCCDAISVNCQICPTCCENHYPYTNCSPLNREILPRHLLILVREVKGFVYEFTSSHFYKCFWWTFHVTCLKIQRQSAAVIRVDLMKGKYIFFGSISLSLDFVY